MNKPEFYRCNVCGNIVGLIENGGGILECCKTPMEKLIPNTQEAAVEKHIPVLERTSNTLKVTVGSVQHPMTEAHYIQWICVMNGLKVQRMRLMPGDKPEATFILDSDEAVEVYAYCNLHGLWTAKI